MEKVGQDGHQTDSLEATPRLGGAQSGSAPSWDDAGGQQNSLDSGVVWLSNPAIFWLSQVTERGGAAWKPTAWMEIPHPSSSCVSVPHINWETVLTLLEGAFCFSGGFALEFFYLANSPLTFRSCPFSFPGSVRHFCSASNLCAFWKNLRKSRQVRVLFGVKNYL